MYPVLVTLVMITAAPMQAVPARTAAPAARPAARPAPDHPAAARHELTRAAVSLPAVERSVQAMTAHVRALNNSAAVDAAVEAAGRVGGYTMPLPPEGWAPQDPADSLWRAARSMLDAGDARRAAELYRRLRTERRFANSEYRPHAFYWEAYARHRI
ncbi:MAG: hypothetical protein ACRELT_07550, partial [Longimicrobiales bacterium]